MDERSIKLAEFAFAWIELREHILGSVPRSNSNVHRALSIADARLNALVATLIAASESSDSINKTLAANARR